MIDVLSKRCDTSGCRKQPCFNVEGSLTGRFCGEHKQADMIDVLSKRCDTSGCRKQPCFNVEGSLTGRFCGEHKQADMINVLSKRCDTSGCNTLATFGSALKRKIHCFRHKAVGEFRVRSCVCCRAAATHSPEGAFPPVTCESHALVTDKALFEATCSDCGFEFVLYADGKCFICTALLKRHRKEDAVYDFLRYAEPRQEGSAPRWKLESRDSRVQGECSSQYRPDFLLDRAGAFKIVVEVDENQHSSYPEACECKRMRQILEDFDGLPVLFIRFNPDCFVDSEGARQSLGQKSRLRELGAVLESYRHTDMLPGLLCLKQLFYDGCDSSTVIIHE